ncbi:hypothetical protein E4U21_007168 [Claviceps maximensis]|nr:hypothetical protein E4U21_007168 [Claviceps maximensis]
MDSNRGTGYGKLIRAGYIRQSQSGIFHLLPLGLRVQNKIEALLDKHMTSIGASKLSLSSLTSEELWRRSGRFDQVSSELFRLADRKKTAMMLSPTHEEEVTSLVASTVKSYKDLPLRLYQTTRKYRDEMRSRHGLLRSREFVMKDLYTFDTSYTSAVSTYHEVAAAYRAFFADLKIPIMVAEASSGDMGGNHSHEYHLPNPIGDDAVLSCDSCDYIANDEVAIAKKPSSSESSMSNQEIQPQDINLWRGVTKNSSSLINAWFPAKNQAGAATKINLHVVKKVIPDLDTSVDNPVKVWGKTVVKNPFSPSLSIINIVDTRLATSYAKLEGHLPIIPDIENQPMIIWYSKPDPIKSHNGRALDLVRLAEGDGCPRCEPGQLHAQKTLELGHTFHLGARYSEPLALSVKLPDSKDPVPVEMGCYGIGVSRIFGAIAEHKADERGLQWPRAIAPFEVVIIPTSGVTDATLDLYDTLTSPSASSGGQTFDVVLDDRKQTFGWKMTDADLIGYPVIVVLGKAWRDKGICEVQCRSLSLKENVAIEDLAPHLASVLARL